MNHLGQQFVLLKKHRCPLVVKEIHVSKIFIFSGPRETFI